MEELTFIPKHQKQFLEKQPNLKLDVLKSLKDIPKRPQNNENYYLNIVYAHYFYGGSDWFISSVSLDKEDSKYSTFSGFAILNNDVEMSEFGYSSVYELANTYPIELDFHWQPKTLKECLLNKDESYFKPIIESFEEELKKEVNYLLNIELLPRVAYLICDKYLKLSEEDLTSNKVFEWEKELKKVGFILEYGLDFQPFEIKQNKN